MKKEDDDCKYGALGIMSKEEAYLERIVDKIKSEDTLHAIGTLRKAIEKGLPKNKK